MKRIVAIAHSLPAKPIAFHQLKYQRWGGRNPFSETVREDIGN